MIAVSVHSPSSTQAMERLFIGGIVHTDSGAQEVAVAVSGGRIAALLSPREATSAQQRRTEVIDLKGAHVFPGWIDAHLHLAGLGAALEQVDCTGLQSWQACIDRAAERARQTEGGRWILGRGWDQNLWKERAFPDRRELDRRVPNHPVLLRRIDGHAAIANSRALEIAGLSETSPDPPGGRLVHRPDGSLSGVLVDTAVELVERHIPAADAATIRRRLLRAARHLASLGLTQVHDAGTTASELEVLLALEAEGRLPLRVWVLLDGSDPTLLQRWFSRGPLRDPERLVRIGGVKLYADGALGSRGALLGMEYADDPGNFGLAVTPQDELRRVIHDAERAGFQVAVHAIGDEAVHRVLDLFEELGPDRCRRLRHRIEHSQVVRPADVFRYARLGVIASVQPTHCISDMAWAPQRLGRDRIAWAYRWRSLLDAGVRLAGGSDAPVEDADPRRGLFAARTRQREDGTPPEGWNPAERLDSRESLLMFTEWAAEAAFAESFCGRIAPGMAADLTIVDRDLLTSPAKDVLSLRVLRTVVAGRDTWVAPVGSRAE